jgi:AraC-like DNA-binding protein
VSEETFRVVGPGKACGVFRDVAEVGRLTDFDIGFRQLDPGPQAIAFRITAGNRVNVMHMNFNCGFHQLATAPSGTLTFGLPVRGMRDWLGRPYEDSSVLPFNGASGIDGVSSPGFQAFTLSIAEDFVRDVSETYQLPVPDYLHSGQLDRIISDSVSVRRLRSKLQKLTSDNMALLGRESEEELIVDLLSAALVDRPIADKSTPAARANALSKVLEYVNKDRHEVDSVGEICAATGVSWRTLDRAFKERFGIGPKAYLQRLRLTGVRNDLADSPPDTFIADVANIWGFWHLGQFAQDYRKLFGELPSETLRRPRA